MKPTLQQVVGALFTLSFVAALALALLVSPKVQAEGEQPAPVQVLPVGQGQAAQCRHPDGCVMLLAPAFDRLLDAAKRAADCRPGLSS